MLICCDDTVAVSISIVVIVVHVTVEAVRGVVPLPAVPRADRWFAVDRLPLVMQGFKCIELSISMAESLRRVPVLVGSFV